MASKEQRGEVISSDINIDENDDDVDLYLPELTVEQENTLSKCKTTKQKISFWMKLLPNLKEEVNPAVQEELDEDKITEDVRTFAFYLSDKYISLSDMKPCNFIEWLLEEQNDFII